ncbi:MAG: hypothetical protein IJ685_02120 [Selenomonadaceae bacterium]|nr:hypothetical protein [Selenomonadaceae bacterium]
MGWFSSACSFIGSAISGACSAVCSVASSVVRGVGSALSTFASKAVGLVAGIASKAASFVGLVATLPLGPLGPVVGAIIQQVVIYAVSKAVEYLAKKLGIIGDKDKAEEVGYRVEEAQEHDDWKRQEDFKTFEEYYAYLKEQIPDEKIDRAKLAANRERYTILGAMELTAGLEQQMEIKLPEDFLFEIGRSRMEPNEILAIVDAFKFLGSDTVYISDYLKGKLSRDENIKIEDALLVALRKYYPNKDDDALYERLGVMRMASRNDEKLADVYADKLTEENFKRIERENRIPEDL